MITFTVDGTPIPKQSYRHSGKGGYTDPRVKAWQNTVGWAAKSAMSGQDIIDSPCGAAIEFRLNHGRRVDLDNLSKAVLDGCNKVVWTDDRWVTELHLYKVRDNDNPGVTVTVEFRGVIE